MEEYKIVRIEEDGFAQSLTLQGVNESARKQLLFNVYSNAGFFKVGDTVKRYIGYNANVVALSYNLGKYKFVELPCAPKTLYDQEHFYADLDFCDRIRLKLDIARSLKSHGIKPSLSSQKNLSALIKQINAYSKVR